MTHKQTNCRLGMFLQLKEKLDKILHIVTPQEKRILRRNMSYLDDQIYTEFQKELNMANSDPYKDCPDNLRKKCSMCPFKTIEKKAELFA